MSDFILSKFDSVEIIGTGAGSTIFRGKSLEDGGMYAIKVVKRVQSGDERFVGQAINEFEIASHFDHHNIIRMYSSQRTRKWFKVVEYDIVMEYFAGRMLSDTRGLSVPQLVKIFKQVADALAYMHLLGYVHTDIKPENILIDDRMQVKVIDLGVACPRGSTKDRVQGTPDFIAPEQISKKPLDERTDIYNLGATMYKVFTGKVLPQNLALLGTPVGNGDALNLAKTAMTDHNPDIPDDVARIVEKCTRRSRTKRFQRMSEVVAALAAATKDDAAGGTAR